MKIKIKIKINIDKDLFPQRIKVGTVKLYF